MLLGPNGSGKSTLFDVFGFLAESMQSGLRPAWDKRGRLRELRSRESDGPISIELRYRERPKSPLITYHVEIDEEAGRPVVRRETLRWKRGSYGKPFNFLDFTNGAGQVISGDLPESKDDRREQKLASMDLLAISTPARCCSSGFPSSRTRRGSDRLSRRLRRVCALRCRRLNPFGEVMVTLRIKVRPGLPRVQDRCTRLS